MKVNLAGGSIHAGGGTLEVGYTCVRRIHAGWNPRGGDGTHAGGGTPAGGGTHAGGHSS